MLPAFSINASVFSSINFSGMTTPTVRIGFIGAGSIARARHLPNLQKLAGVKIVAVSNRGRASAQAVARDFGIPRVIDDWRELLKQSDLDAVFIGTWPYTHCEMTIAALEAGKHVFCQARMAMNLAEARAMLAAAKAHPTLVSQICPPPTRMPFEPFVRNLLSRGEMGDIYAVELLSHSGANLHTDAVHWRELREFSGNQVMAVGIYAETLNAWVGPYERLTACTATPVAAKHSAGRSVSIDVPQVVTICGQLENGAVAVEHHLGLASDKTTLGDSLTIWGRQGTLRYTFGQTIEWAAAGQPLKPVVVPDSLQRGWRVEEDFIASIHSSQSGGTARIGMNPDFSEGLAYMKKVEAVHVSASTGREAKLASL